MSKNASASATPNCAATRGPTADGELSSSGGMWSRTCISLALLLSVWLLMAIASSRTCPSTFRALLISDVHDDVAAVRRLRSLLERQGALSQIDVVLSPGDLTTTPCSRNSDVQRAYERPAKRMLEELAAFGRPVFFVPGNHDPLFLFNQTASATEAGAGVHNAHGRTFELAAGLRLLGWGGGSAAFEDDKRVWEGWPYAETEVAFGLRFWLGLVLTLILTGNPTLALTLSLTLTLTPTLALWWQALDARLQQSRQTFLPLR